MKLKGIKYLDANDYDRIIMRNIYDDLTITITGDVNYETIKDKHPFSKSIDRTNEDNAILEIVSYFLRNNEINKINEFEFLPRYYDKFIGIYTPYKDMHLQLKLTEKTKHIPKMILDKYYIDRYNKVYNEENVTCYEISVSLQDSNYAIYYLNEDKKMRIVLKGNKNTKRLDKNDWIFIEDFIRYKLSLCENEATFKKIKYYSPIVGEYFESDNYLYCDDLVICVRDNVLFPIIDNLVYEHNKNIREEKSLQLKMKGF